MEQPLMPAEGGEEMSQEGSSEQGEAGAEFETKVASAIDALRQGLPLTRRDWTKEVALEAIRRFDEEKAGKSGS
jgi:hypothetical protein